MKRQAPAMTAEEYRAQVAARMREDAFQAQLLDLARALGWRVAHFRPARTARGWRTPVSGDGEGWPDLVLVRGGRLLFRELKSAKGDLSVEQEEWLDALSLAGQDVGVWRPADWDHIAAVLA